MLQLDIIPDIAGDPGDVEGNVEARVYYALGYTPAEQGVAQLTLNDYSPEEESPTSIFHEVQDRLKVFLDMDKVLDAKQFAAFCVLKEYALEDGETDENRVARLGSYAIVRTNEQRPIAIEAQSSRGEISRWGYSRAVRQEDVIGIHSLIHLPITNHEAIMFPQVTHMLKAAARVGGVFQPYVALHARPDGSHRIEELLQVEQLQ